MWIKSSKLFTNTMKKNILLLLSLLLLASCQTVTFEDIDADGGGETGSKCMNFVYHGFSMTEIDGNEIGETIGTKAATDKKYTDNLLLGIFDMDGTLVDSIQYQSKNDTTIQYGNFSHVLKYGRYIVLAMGWDGSQKCHVHSLDSIYFSENWVPNTFLCRKNIIVNDTYSDTREISLKRCVSRFMLYLEDEVYPEQVSKITINISGAGSTLDSESQHCTHVQSFEREIPVNIAPSKIKSLTSYCFLPTDSANIGIEICAVDADGEIVTSRKFNDVPAKINYSTNYTGNFFNYYSGNSDIAIEAEFEGEINVHF